MSTRLTTVHQLRETRRNKIPMFRIEFMPYIDAIDPETGFPFERKYERGRNEEIYTNRAEAIRRYEVLSSAQRSIELDTLELYEVSYPETGGWANTLLRENGQ